MPDTLTSAAPTNALAPANPNHVEQLANDSTDILIAEKPLNSEKPILNSENVILINGTRKRRRLRRYAKHTQDDVASAIAAASTGLSCRKTARALALPLSTTHRLLKRNPEALAASRLETAHRAQEIVGLAMDCTEAALPSASALQAATVAGIMVDKSLLLTGQGPDGCRTSSAPTVTQNIQFSVTPVEQAAFAHALGQAIALLCRAQPTPAQPTTPPVEVQVLPCHDATTEPSLIDPTETKPDGAGNL